MKLIDSHCHLHETEFFPDEAAQEAAYQRAVAAGVGIVCVATSERASQEALDFVTGHDQTWAVLGVHPHEAKHGCAGIAPLLAQCHAKVVGIGEIGLDYYYNNSPRQAQIAVLEQQLQWAVQYGLPVSFHVRDTASREQGSVWDDFWPILDNFHGIRGVLHSFTDTQTNLDRGFSRGLYVGINGISTFTKDPQQREMFARIPIERMLIETDAPFLTPAPFRGTMNEPSFAGNVAQCAAALRGVEYDLVCATTVANTKQLFGI